MKPSESIARLIDLGFHEEDARTRLALIDRVEAEHERASGREPAWSWFVPGRIEIFGKHTDYAGGRSLLAAVPRGFVMAASPREDGAVRVRDAVSGHSGVVSNDGAVPDEVHGLGYVGAVVRRFAANFPGAPLGLDLTLGSDLPRAAGMSSSSALVVGTALALVRRAELDARPEWLREIRTTYDLAAYLGALERGSDYGALAGAHAVGVLGGSEDHTAILACQPDFVSACRFVPMQPLGDARMPPDWRFVVTTSGVVADKAGGARDRYNRASLAAEALVDLWKRKTGRSDRTLAEITALTDGIANLDDLAKESGGGAFSPDELRRRLAHFAGEDSRILDALGAFGGADVATIGALARASQADAEALLQNQTAETTALARLAIEQGAFAASSFGAGFGGSVWALTTAGDADVLGERWSSAYRAAHPRVPATSWFACRPGPPAFQWR